ncbi:hypothetical protein BCV69DRAFT_261525, partial [Microstroma glucosiphilum]
MKYTSVAALVAALAVSTSFVAASPVLPRQESTASSAATSAASDASSATSTTDSASSSSSSSSASAAASSSSSTGTSSASSSAASSTSSSSSFNRSSDIDILRYALTLENLEAAFYNQSLTNLSAVDFEDAGVNSSYRDQIYSIGQDEAAHVSLLSFALGNETLQPCTYNFSSVTDVPSFLATARLLEGVGISAYLGALTSISNATYQLIAAAITTVESRHQTALNAIAMAPNFVPAPYDTPLNFTEVYSLAAPYIESCPMDLGLTAFPSLTLTPTNLSMGNSSSNSSSSNTTYYVAFLSGVVGTRFVELPSNMTVNVPSDISGGQFYALLTHSNSTPITDSRVVAGPA